MQALQARPCALASNTVRMKTIPLLMIASLTLLIFIAQGQTGESAFTYISVGKTPAVTLNSGRPENVDVLPSVKAAINPDRFALIIGNENYESFSIGLNNTIYAAHDAEVFSRYAVQVLGIPERNVFFRVNVPSGMFKGLLTRLVSAVNLNEGTPEVFIFYAGHGIQGETPGTSYLLPVDADLVSLDKSYELNTLLKTIAATKADKIVYFLDACFTGSGRSGNVLASARGIEFTPSPDAIPGNSVVFTAGTGRQPALGYQDANHGLFTYHLLLAMKNHRSTMNLDRFTAEVSSGVTAASIRISGSLQTPTVRTGRVVSSSWKSWRLTE